MNRIYRLIWNDKAGSFVAVSEIVKSAGRKSASGENVVGGSARFALKGLAISLMLAISSNAYALPAGGVVAAGDVSISSDAGSTIITQSTPNAAINWQSFNIGQTEAVQFVQPNSSSTTLNRVLGSDPSSILGSLSANGHVFLLNPNGILFGQGAQVNVGGLVASTLNITDSDFMAGRYNFTGAATTAVFNQGSLNADGGYVALLGANVSNEGVISARLGTVALAAGNAITLDVAGDGLLNVTVNQGAINALVQNGGLIQADGGQVLLTAQAAGGLLQSAVNNTGVIQAQTIENHNGTIMLMGDMQSGTVNVGGLLDASAPNGGDGGFIETSAAYVKIANGTIINTQSALGKAGTWLIDPFDFTIGDAIGDDITPADLAIALASNVIISSNDGGTGTLGNINVNNDVTWGAATTLTLNAVHDVNLNANITATTGSLVLNAENDIIANAMAGTGITTTGGSNTWTAGRDIMVNAGVVGGITTTNGNITWIAGRDVTVDSAVTVTDGDFSVCCGRDININAAVTTTDGDVSLIAGRDISITADMTTTRGNVLLSAGPDATGVGGPLGGTVVFGPGVLYTVTAPGTAITIDYTPDSYSDPLHDYSGNFTGDASSFLTTRMLVFAQGNDKVYDGNTTATLSFRGDPTLGGDITLVPGTASFDTKDVGTDKPIIYSGYSLGGADTAKFVLWAPCDAVAGSGSTSADITPAPLTILADNATKIYGQTFIPGNTAFTTPVGPVAGETVASVTLTSPEGTPVTASVAGSPYAIIPSNAAANGAFLPTNYDITYVNGNLLVNPAPLTVTASDVSKIYGEAPALSAFTTAGLLNDDTVGSVTLTSPGQPAAASVAGSPYAIIPSNATGGTFVPTNYTITYVNGILTITPLALVGSITAADKFYDGNNSATILTRELTGAIAGDDVSYTGGTATFDTPAVGTDKTVTGTGLGLAGTDAGNYTVNSTATTMADIFAVPPVPVVVPPVTPPVTPPVVPPLVVVTPPFSPPTVVEVPETAPVVVVPETAPVEEQPFSPPPVVVVPETAPVKALNLTVIGPGVLMPATQLTEAQLAPPTMPVVVRPEMPPVAVPPETPPAETPPVVVPPETPEEIYVPPHYPRKTDRN